MVFIAAVSAAKVSSSTVVTPGYKPVTTLRVMCIYKKRETCNSSDDLRILLYIRGQRIPYSNRNIVFVTGR